MKTYTLNQAGIEHIRLQLVDKLKDAEWFDAPLSDSAETRAMLSEWAAEIEEDSLSRREPFGEAELSQHQTKSGHTQFIYAGEEHFDVVNQSRTDLESAKLDLAAILMDLTGTDQSDDQAFAEMCAVAEGQLEDFLNNWIR